MKNDRHVFLMYINNILCKHRQLLCKYHRLIYHQSSPTKDYNLSLTAGCTFHRNVICA